MKAAGKCRVAEGISGVVLQIKVGIHAGSSVDEAPWAPRSSDLGAKIEAPKGVGCGKGVSLFPLGSLGMGLCPLPIFLVFALKMVGFVHFESYFTVALLVYSEG